MTALFGGASAQTLSLPNFVNRQLAVSEKHRFANIAPDSFVKSFNSVNPERSLLIHDCGLGSSSWCEHSGLQFRAVLKAVGAGGWPGRGHHIDGFATNSQFHVLALVNRLDLAEWRNGAAHNAEIRIVYGLKQKTFNREKTLTVIVEFVLPPMTWTNFHDLAEQWRSMSGKPCEDRGFDNCLVKHLIPQFGQRRSFVRVRANFNLDPLPSWDMAQWIADSAGFRLTDLEDQVAEFPDEAGFRGIWDQLAHVPEPRRMPIPETLTVPSRTYTHGMQPDPPSFGMWQLQGRCRPVDEKVRNILSLQQCTFCHAGETNTEFMHVENRSPLQNVAPLSKFLTGGNANATLEDLSGGVAFKAEVRYYRPKAQRSSLCTEQRPDKLVRPFHDLGRRRLFIAAVLADTAKQPRAETLSLMRAYAPDFSH